MYTFLSVEFYSQVVNMRSKQHHKKKIREKSISCRTTKKNYNSLLAIAKRKEITISECLHRIITKEVEET